MPEVAYQNPPVEENLDHLENQILDCASNMQIKALGRSLIAYIDHDNEGFSTRCSAGQKLDRAFIEDFNFIQTVSNRLRYHLKNDFNHKQETGFESFKIVSEGGSYRVFSIDADGKENDCFGTKMDSDLSNDTISIKYSQATSDEPLYTFNGKNYDCQEVFEIVKWPKGKLAQKMTMRKYFIEGRQYVTYSLVVEDPEKSHIPKENETKVKNFSTINL